MARAAYFDITALMDLLKGEKEVLRVVETNRDFYMGSLTAAMLIGVEEYLVEKKIVKSRERRELVDSFKILSVNKGDAEEAGEIIGKMKSKGKNVSVEEAISAAQCFRRGLTLVTNNDNFKDFKSVVDIKIQKI